MTQNLSRLLLCVLIALGAPLAFAEQQVVKVTGSSTMFPLVTALAKRFQLLRPGVSVRVEPGGSQHGIDAARNGQADIGMVSRTLTDADKDLFSFAIGRDGVGFVVHTDNHLSELSTANLRDIYTGRLINWNQLGGASVPISPVSRAKGAASLELFLHYFDLKEESLKAAFATGENAETVSAVARNPGAIAYLSIGETERQAQSGVPLKLLVIDGVAASARNVRRGDYPILRQLTLVTRQLPEGPSKQFIDFCLSSGATEIVREHDFVPYVD